MTRQEAIQRAKSNIILNMAHFLDTSNVTNSVANFVANNIDYAPASDCDKIKSEIDSLIKRLETMKALVEESKQGIIESECF